MLFRSRLRRPDPDLFHRFHAGPGVEHHGKSRGERDEKNGRKIPEAEPENEERRVSQAGNRIADAHERQKEILGPAVAAHDDPEPHSGEPGKKEREDQPEQRAEGMDRKNPVGDEASESGDDRLDRKSTRLNSSHIQKSRMPSSA